MNTIPIGTTFRSTRFTAQLNRPDNEARLFVLGYSTKCNDKLHLEYMYDIVMYELGTCAGPAGEPVFFQEPRQVTDDYLERLIEMFQFEVVFEETLADEMKDYHKE